MSRNTMLKPILAAVCLALGILLPFLTGNIPHFGKALCPMHIPVLLCGFLCGPWWGTAVGCTTPLLRALLVGMPPLFPTVMVSGALVMAVELAVYGLSAGLLHRLLPKRVPYLYASLLGAMLLGRVAWGLACMPVYRLFSELVFSWELFAAGAFTGAIPGILLHILLIPPIVMVLQKARLFPRSEGTA